jgi:NADPH-dependent 2,4-dienoyl-CoA reductase/sulfur reductase-like enzyme
MTRMKCDIAVVGSGFSGLVAAHILATHGLRILLLDENTRMGGQMLRSLPWRGNTRRVDSLRNFGFRLIEGVKRKPIEAVNRIKILEVDRETRLLAEKDGHEIMTVESDLLLFATGARERFLPFRGWTVPGVISTGAAQILMKSSGILPARRMLIAGAGPLLLAVANEFLRSGGEVLSILDMGGVREKLLLLTQGIHQLPKVTEGALFLSRIFLAGVSLLHRTAVVEARGKPELNEVIAARLDAKGAIVQGTERIYKTRCLAVGHGFTPNIELPQLAGCALEYDEAKGGWVVAVGRDLETSVDRVFAAGEMTGIAGAPKSVHEGRLAAYGMLHKMGKRLDSELLDRLRRQRSRHLRFGRYFNALHRIPPQAVLSIPDETLICRCEEVRMKDIRRAFTEGYDTPAALKRALRIGMGNCQGRLCAPVMYDILSAFTHGKGEDFPPLSVRSPVKPVAMRSFLE